MASDYCYSVEMERVLARHETSETRVIPIILRPVIDWEMAPFGKLQALPRDAKPITTWQTSDEAWASIAENIRSVCEEIQLLYNINLAPEDDLLINPVYARYLYTVKMELQGLLWSIKENMQELSRYTMGASNSLARLLWLDEIQELSSFPTIPSGSDEAQELSGFLRSKDKGSEDKLLINPMTARDLYIKNEIQELSSFLQHSSTKLDRNINVGLVSMDNLGLHLATDLQSENDLLIGDMPDAGSIDLSRCHHLNDVFVKSGFPSVTYVEREDFGLLKLALTQPGRGVVIEGPSGVGKTTALKKAIAEIKSDSSEQSGAAKIGTLVILSARNPEHCARLETLWDWHNGTVIIDDFHRLGSSLCEKIADYLKFLADTEPRSKKLVIIGIPQTGQMLVDISFDVATRIDVFKLGQVKDRLVRNMIEKGERALNIRFDRKVDIVLAASGSLNIAQFLCFNICQREHVIRTQDLLSLISCNIDDAISSVMGDLSRRFGACIERFAAMGGRRDKTCLELLEELAHNKDGFVALPTLKGIRPELAHGIERFIRGKWMSKLYSENSDYKNFLFFNQTAQALVVDDPQLTFYLKKINYPMLAKKAGKAAPHERGKVFVSYSQKDAKWLERIQVYLKPIERDSRIELWDDTKIIAGAKWKEQIQDAIASATVAVILVSADFLASDFIVEYQLPMLLSQASDEGTTILPIIVSSCLFEYTGLDVFQPVNPPDKPLALMEPSEQDQTLFELARAIKEQVAERR
jgi:TIR domain